MLDNTVSEPQAQADPAVAAMQAIVEAVKHMREIRDHEEFAVATKAMCIAADWAEDTSEEMLNKLLGIKPMEVGWTAQDLAGKI